MRIVSILCLGALALLALEIAYSLQLRRYESCCAPDRTFFRGPITVTLKAVLNLRDEPEPQKALTRRRA